MDELKDILTEEKAEVVEEKVEEKTEPEVEKAQSRRKQHQEKEQKARDEGGRFVKEEPKEEPKEEVKEEPKAEAKVEPKQEMSEKERAFLAAAQEERRKRQDLERRLAEIEKAKPKEDAKTFWDDPEGHLKSFEQKLEQERIQTKLHTAEAIARSKYQDFDEKVGVFAEILQSTPGLHAQWLQSPDPAEFAYRLGKHTKELRDVGSIDNLRSKIEKETRLKLEAEYKKKQEDQEKQRQDLTSSLSDVRGAARRTEPVYSGPTPLDAILSEK